MLTDKNRSSLASLEFATTAKDFCDWCERPSGALSDNEAAYWLGRLYSDALKLPETGPENGEDLPDLPQSAHLKAKENLAPFWGRYYRHCFDPAPELNEEPVIGDLGDDLLDTYQDIRAGLVLYELEKQSEALWYWSFLHRIHWGRHASGALNALHCMSVSQAG